MKKVLILVAFLLICPTLLTDEEEVLFKGDGSASHGGFAGVGMKATRVNGKNAILVGGKWAWIINHKWLIDGGGYGLTTKHEVGIQNKKLDLNLGLQALFLFNP